MIPVAAAPVIVPDNPEASPATYAFFRVVCISFVALTNDDLNFTSGAYKSVDPELTPGITTSNFSNPSIILVTSLCGSAMEISPGVTDFKWREDLTIDFANLEGVLLLPRLKSVNL